MENGIENGKPKKDKTFDEMMEEMDERRKHGESTDLDDPAVKGLIPEGERALQGEEKQMPIEETDEAVLVDRLKDVRSRRKAAQKMLTERFGNRGEKVEGTPGYSWHDSAKDSMWVVRKDGETQEIQKGETWDFGQRGEHLWKRWRGRDEGGWVGVDDEAPIQRRREDYRREKVVPSAAVPDEKDIALMSPEELQAERARLIGRAREMNVDISDIVPAAAPAMPQNSLRVESKTEQRKPRRNGRKESYPPEFGRSKRKRIISEGGQTREEEFDDTIGAFVSTDKTGPMPPPIPSQVPDISTPSIPAQAPEVKPPPLEGWEEREAERNKQSTPSPLPHIPTLEDQIADIRRSIVRAPDAPPPIPAATQKRDESADMVERARQALANATSPSIEWGAPESGDGLIHRLRRWLKS